MTLKPASSSPPSNGVPERVEIERNRWGQPLLVPPDGGTRVPYARMSGFADVVDDQSGLTLWKQRQTALGVAQRDDIRLGVNAHRDDKSALNKLVKEALEAAQSNARASVGTSMHRYAELCDRGLDPGFVPTPYDQDLNAYLDLTRPLFEHVAIERFCVVDEFRIAGTPDRISILKQDMTAPDGAVIPAGSAVVLDEKTSGSLSFGGLKFSGQVAAAAHSTPYDPATDERGSWGVEVRKDWGLIVWCPAGEGRAELHWVDLRAGWDIVAFAADVRLWRKRGKGLITKAAAVERAEDFRITAASASSVDELREAARRANAAGAWSDELRNVFSARKAELGGHLTVVSS